MKMRFKGLMDRRHQKKDGWSLLVKEQEARQNNQMSRSSQRHISMGIGHHMPRMMKGHI